MKVAQLFRGKGVTFAVSNRDDYSSEMTELGLAAAAEKPVVGARNAEGQKFPMEEEFS